MLATVLRSDRAVHVSVEIVRAFIRLRRALESHGELAKKLEALDRCTRSSAWTKAAAHESVRAKHPEWDEAISAASAAAAESRTLAALRRDTLLPKLMSGELRVRDAERLAANAGV